MHDVRAIRDDPDAFDAALARRDMPAASPTILDLDRNLRGIATELQVGQARRNEASKAIGQAKATGDDDDADALMKEVAVLKHSLPELEARQRAVADELNAALAALPNLLGDDVPPGADESANVEVAHWGEPRAFDFAPRDHAELGPPLGLEFETAARMSGARFAFLRGPAARLHRALGQFMLDFQVEKNGFTECAPPLLVRDEAVFGTGQLPKFADDLFQTTDGRWLIPTAEVSLTNSVRDRLLDADALPIRLAALTPCFRSEAGAAGKDTKGLIRQHQFEKVEMVAIVAPDGSEGEHERMTAAAEGVLRALDLPYRRMLLCAGDTGASAAKTFDLEVWLPGQAAYREISSVSNARDYQARRMNARVRSGPKRTEFVHTLNGSGVAVGRALVAVIENGQRADGSVAMPEALRAYMGGLESIAPAS